MIRVLHIMGHADVGGISTVVLNYMKHIDQSKIHFDFALTGSEPGVNGKTMIAMGAKYYRLPLKSQGILKFRTALYELLTKEHFDVIHVHSSSTSFVALQVAKKAGVKCRFAHAHTTMNGGWKTQLRRILGCTLNYHYATKVIGCGKLAGDSIFGKRHMLSPKGVVLPNAIDTSIFRFDAAARTEVRDELSIGKQYALALVGRLSPQKNQFFALDVMKKIHESNVNVVLYLIGTGEWEDRLKHTIEENGLESCVKMLGRRTDMIRLYQGMDCCILPSLYEGFPVTGVEAIAAGLPLIISDKVTDELKFGSAVKYLPLDRDTWAEEILRCANIDDTSLRDTRSREAADNGFDINATSKQLENLYMECYQR